MPMVRIESAIPRPPDPGRASCRPGSNERGDWIPTEFYLIMTPTHKTGVLKERLKLPWRASNAYPEVEVSFTALREAFERVLEESADSAPMNVSGRLDTTKKTRRAVAPAFAADRILRVVNK